MLLNEARKITGKRLIFFLDADEFISCNVFQSKEWNELKRLEPGSTILFRWVNICPGFNKYWSPELYMHFAYMDDNSEYKGIKVHGPRLPYNKEKLKYSSEIKILHFQYTNWERMKSKQRWYLCFERLNIYNDPIGNFRKYSHMYRVKKSEMKVFKKNNVSH